MWNHLQILHGGKTLVAFDEGNRPVLVLELEKTQNVRVLRQQNIAKVEHLPDGALKVYTPKVPQPAAPLPMSERYRQEVISGREVERMRQAALEEAKRYAIEAQRQQRRKEVQDRIDAQRKADVGRKLAEANARAAAEPKLPLARYRKVGGNYRAWGIYGGIDYIEVNPGGTFVVYQNGDKRKTYQFSREYLDKVSSGAGNAGWVSLPIAASEQGAYQPAPAYTAYPWGASVADAKLLGPARRFRNRGGFKDSTDYVEARAYDTTGGVLVQKDNGRRIPAEWWTLDRCLAAVNRGDWIEVPVLTVKSPVPAGTKVAGWMPGW